MAPQEMESLFLEQWRHYMRHSWHAKFEKGENAAIINLFTYLYIPQQPVFFFLFLPPWNEARFDVQMVGVIPF